MSDDAKIVSIDPFVQPAARRILEHAGLPFFDDFMTPPPV